MDLKSFITYYKKLYNFYNLGFQIDDLLGVNLTTESFLGTILDNYGALMYELIELSKGGRITEELDMAFWNLMFSDNLSDEKIINLYNMIIENMEYEEGEDEHGE